MNYSPSSTSVFDHHVRLRYQLYNSLFLTLPFDLIHQTGTLRPLLSASACSCAASAWRRASADGA
jgi:hypothetical protein